MKTAKLLTKAISLRKGLSKFEREDSHNEAYSKAYDKLINRLTDDVGFIIMDEDEFAVYIAEKLDNIKGMFGWYCRAKWALDQLDWLMRPIEE